MADVDMKPADEKKADESKPAPVPAPPPSPVAEIKANVTLIERAVSTMEPRFTHRVLRTLAGLRKQLNDTVLYDAIDGIYPKESLVRASLLSWLPSSVSQTMDVDAPSKSATSDPVPEVEIYLRLILIHHILTTDATKALSLAQETIQKMQALNRRSMDPIAAKVWFAVERAYELGGELADARGMFLAAQRIAALRHDAESEASLINRLVRSYLHYNLYDQADKLVSKTTFPESAGNAQFTRYHYFIGRIKAVQLDYTQAHTHLQQAIRRASAPKMAPGFYQAVHKLFVIVELLMGDIPERRLFRHPVLEKPMVAYFEIVKAVRSGSLSIFQTTLSKFGKQFETDRTYALIVRLRQNVIKTGIRRLSLAYSRISLRDICIKLHLDSEEDAEYIVGKAIRDGVIDAKIVHEKGWMECATQKVGYGPEVSEQFQRRIAYCMELHNQSVKAMRYPLNAHRKELAAAEGAREREKELAKGIQEGDIDEDDLGGGPEF